MRLLRNEFRTKSAIVVPNLEFVIPQNLINNNKLHVFCLLWVGESCIVSTTGLHVLLKRKAALTWF